MFNKLLVPIDGSVTSELAVDRAIALAKAFSGTVRLLYVVDPYPFSGVGEGFAYGLTEYLNAARAEAETALESARTKVQAAGVDVSTAMVEATAVWRGILDAASGNSTDLIVMGSHGRSGIEKLVLGSVAQRVVAQAAIAVLVVRG